MIENWHRFEKELARKLKGMLTPGSGNKSMKGDVHTDIFVIEAKWRAFTYNGEYYLTLEEEWLKTISQEARSYCREPLLALSIADVRVYYLIRYDFWIGCEGRMESVTCVTRDLEDKKQLRMYAKEDFSYNIFDFHEAGIWIALPEDDLMFLVRLARQEEEQECKEPKKSRWSRPVKSDYQRTKEKEWRDRQKAYRKKLYRELKDRRSEQ